MFNSSITPYKHNNYDEPYDAITKSTKHIAEAVENVSSLRIKGGPWVLYSQENYQGNTEVLHHGDYPNSKFFSQVGNDKLHSVQLLPATGICLFPEDNFNGAFVHVEEGGQNLNVTAKSIIVRSGEWDVFTTADPKADADSEGTVPIGIHPHNPIDLHRKTIKAVRPSKVKGNIQIFSETDASEVENNGNIIHLGDAPAIEILVDGSGSMRYDSKMTTAKTVLKDLVVNDIPEGAQIALRVFGTVGCQSELVYPLKNFDEKKLLETIDEISANGDTPIAATIKMVQSDLSGAAGDKLVILITDGKETCASDANAAHAEILELNRHGLQTVVNIVGFAINDAALKGRFESWAVAGNGHYYDAEDASQLGKQMRKALQVQYTIRRSDDMSVVAVGYVDGEAVELDAGIEYKIEYVLPGHNKYQRGDILVEGGKTVKIPVYRGK